MSLSFHTTCLVMGWGGGGMFHTTCLVMGWGVGVCHYPSIQPAFWQLFSVSVYTRDITVAVLTYLT